MRPLRKRRQCFFQVLVWSCKHSLHKCCIQIRSLLNAKLGQGNVSLRAAISEWLWMSDSFPRTEGPEPASCWASSTAINQLGAERLLASWKKSSPTSESIHYTWMLRHFTHTECHASLCPCHPHLQLEYQCKSLSILDIIPFLSMFFSSTSTVCQRQIPTLLSRSLIWITHQAEDACRHAS